MTKIWYRNFTNRMDEIISDMRFLKTKEMEVKKPAKMKSKIMKIKKIKCDML